MKAYIFIETGEERRPKKHEWLLTDSENAVRATIDFACEYPILRRIEVELPTMWEVNEIPGEVNPDYRFRDGFDFGIAWLCDRLGIELKD